jgi:hypothetical protein
MRRTSSEWTGALETPAWESGPARAQPHRAAPLLSARTVPCASLCTFTYYCSIQTCPCLTNEEAGRYNFMKAGSGYHPLHLLIPAKASFPRISLRYAEPSDVLPGQNRGIQIRTRKQRNSPNFIYEVWTISMAGMEGFEPPNAGTRTQCLTTWRHPNRTSGNCTTSPCKTQVFRVLRLEIFEACNDLFCIVIRCYVIGMRGF